MTRALLPGRLKKWEAAGFVAREVSTSDPAVFEYQLTEAGRELGPLVEAFGIWGQRRIESDLSLAHLDAHLLMWDMRRSLNITAMQTRRSVVGFVYPKQPGAPRRYWLGVDPRTGRALCKVHPRFAVVPYPEGGISESCGRLLLRRSRGRGHRCAGGHGLFSLQLLAILVGLAGECFHALESGRREGQGRGRTRRDFREDLLQPAEVL